MIERTGVMDFEFVTYLWVALLSFWGGIANYVSKVKSGTSRFNIMEIVGEIIVSGFAGIMTFYLCAASGTPELITAFAVGLSGHMGARVITQFEIFVSHKLGLPKKDN